MLIIRETAKALLQSNYRGSLTKYPSASPGRGGWGLPSLLPLVLLFKQPCVSALPKLLFSCLRAELLRGTSGTKGLAHFYSAHMPASPVGGQQQENRGGWRRGDRLVTPNRALWIFFPPHNVKYQQRKIQIAFHISTDNTYSKFIVTHLNTFLVGLL